MYVLACHPGGGYVMGGQDMQSLYLHGKASVGSDSFPASIALTPFC